MPRQGLPATIPDHEAPETARRVRIPPKVRQAVNLLASGECKTQKAAAARVGLSPEHLSRSLAMPHVRMFIAQEARKTIATGAARASIRMLELVDAGSEHVSLDAAKHVLAIEGIKPRADAQVSVNIDIKAGYVIDLSEPGASGAVMAHDRATDAKPLIEHETVRNDHGE